MVCHGWFCALNINMETTTITTTELNMLGVAYAPQESFATYRASSGYGSESKVVQALER